MTENEAMMRIRGIAMPEYYMEYYSGLSDETYTTFQAASFAKSSLVDSSAIIEPKIAFDLADRVSKMHEINIAKPLRALLKSHGKEKSALILSREIAQGKYSAPDTELQKRLDLAIRVGLAIVTEGVTIAPLQGISEIRIKKNKDGSEYLSVSIAGPMRSAGGTESAVTMLIADHVRKTAGLSKFQADSFDDETGRFVEELRIYEREAGNFQFHITDEDIITAISNLPVELDGVDTDPYEVVNHKGMARIKTDRVRGGALRVLNDGIVGRAKKLSKRLETYELEDWDWLNDLKGAVKTTSSEDSAAKRMEEVIAGRSVLSAPKKLGGFRLRYGRACNTGFASVGLHPVVAEILEHTVTVGTQVKIDMPGKAATIAFVDSIETPTVLLKNGEVVRIEDTTHGIRIKDEIARVLHMGDVLVSFGDFVENNYDLVESGYVEEFWAAHLREAAGDAAADATGFLKKTPGLEEALALSRKYGIPLHPKYLFYWDQISGDDLRQLCKPLESSPTSVRYAISEKRILEILGVPHRVNADGILLGEPESEIFHTVLLKKIPEIDGSRTVPEMLTESSGIKIRPKFSTAVGIRIGRPEKAAPRTQRPPAHALFPVGEKGGPMRDLLKASGEVFYANILNRRCLACDIPSVGMLCGRCGKKPTITYSCPRCRETLEEPFCKRCNKKARPHSHQRFPLKEELARIQEKLGIRAQTPFKGLTDLNNQQKMAEPLEKGLMRQKFGVTVFRDGTVRFDATNSPLTHFTPAWIGTPVEKLLELGYTHDIDGRPLENPDQLLELRMQDIIIPSECGEYLLNTCRYIDMELQKFYEKPPFYKITDISGLLGHLLIGLAPHTSVGIVGRVIGYTNTHVCFGTPNWHSAKRRDADGDADSLMLLMDALLNFSREFLSDKIGGLMDAPLLIQPLVLPHESQAQAHNIEAVRSFPLEFFDETLRRSNSSGLSCVETMKSRHELESQFHDCHFTHSTASLVASKPRSAYATLNSILDKIDLQIRNAELIDVLDPSEIISHVISTHLVPDIMGNMRAYARQSVRCTGCGAKFRRIPLSGRCTCGHVLILTITRPSVEKYLNHAKRFVKKYQVSRYQRGRVLVLADELELLFGKSGGDQTLLSDF